LSYIDKIKSSFKIIEDPKTDMVAFLRKVESMLNYNIEVRNYLVDKPYNTEQS
jgi:hypothetical protein